MKKLILLLIVIVSMSGCVVIPGRLHHEKRIQMYRNYPRQYYYHSGLFSYFFSGNGTPETNLNNKVMTIGEKTVIQPLSIPQAMKNIPHQSKASPK